MPKARWEGLGHGRGTTTYRKGTQTRKPPPVAHRLPSLNDTQPLSTNFPKKQNTKKVKLNWPFTMVSTHGGAVAVEAPMTRFVFSALTGGVNDSQQQPAAAEYRWWPPRMVWAGIREDGALKVVPCGLVRARHRTPSHLDASRWEDVLF